MVNFWSKLRRKQEQEPESHEVYGLDIQHAAFFAKELAENELLLRIFEGNKKKIFELWTSTSHDKPEVREELYSRFKALERLELDIQGIINSARLEREQKENLKAHQPVN